MRRVIIVGAAGMDYHVFNTVYRNNPDYEVAAFTLAPEQNLGTVGGLRRFPASLAGSRYPAGIPTYPETELAKLIKDLRIDDVVFAYSDVSHKHVMHVASAALAAGAAFRIHSPAEVQLESSRLVVAVCAIRTGCGKSQTSRRVYGLLQQLGLRVVAVREPMPYGDLERQVWQRFSSWEDLDRANATIEEREEFEPYIENGMTIYAGCDYAEILSRAEAEADAIVFDGGNNEISFFKPDCLIVVADPLRAGAEIDYHPGEVNLRMADVVVINKEDSATRRQIQRVMKSVRRINPAAKIVHAESPLTVTNPNDIKGKRVLVVEDGPTVTHGDMAYGAGLIAAKQFGAAEIVDPRISAVGSLREALNRFRHLRVVLPAMGYSQEQLSDLAQSINLAECDVVVSGTPIDLSRIIRVNKPIVRVRYSLKEIGSPNLADILSTLVSNRRS